MPRNEKQRLYQQWAGRVQKHYREMENAGKHGLPKYATKYIKKETKSETDNHSEPDSVNTDHPVNDGNDQGGSTGGQTERGDVEE